MPGWMMFLIAGLAWTGLFVVVWGLVAAAGRADRRAETAATAVVVPRDHAPGATSLAGHGRRAPLVVDVGDVLARLRVAERVMDAERLWITVPARGGEAVLAASRPVVRVTEEDLDRLRTPILADGAEIGALYAERRTASAFDGGDRLLLDALAARLADLLDVGHPSSDHARRRLHALA